MKAVSIRQYACERGLRPDRVRRWIRDRGAPCLQRGRPGPGGQTLVDPEALDRWRGVCAQDVDEMLDRIAHALHDTMFRTLTDRTAPQALGIRSRQAAALLCFAFERIERELNPEPSGRLPESIERLRTICHRADD